MTALAARFSNFLRRHLPSFLVSFCTLAAIAGSAHAVITTTIVDGVGDVGRHGSMQLNASGFPVVAYYDVTNGDLKLAVCGDSGCNTVAHTTIEATGDVGLFASLQLNAAGHPVISYHDASNGTLKLAQCGDASCSTSTIVTLDSAGIVGQYTSLQLAASGAAVVSYFDATAADLKVAFCSDALCSSSTLQTVDAGSNVGQFTSLQLNGSGFPVVSYWDSGNDNLKLAFCNDATCSTPATITTLGAAGSTGLYTSLRLNAAGFAVVSHHDQAAGALRMQVCSNPACTASTGALLELSPATGQHTSLRLAGNRPFISYHDGGNADLKVRICFNAVCTSGVPLVVDSTGAVGEFTSLQLDAGGYPVISYYDATNGDLKLATLSAATITSVDVPANANYVTGQNLDFTVNWTDAVDVVGAPQLPISIGASAVNATYLSGSGTNALVFRYTVQAADFDSDGIAVGSALALNGGAIAWVGFAAELALAGVPATDAVLVNNAFIVTPSAGINGSISPATPQSIAVGNTASFTLTADPGYTAVVAGSCGGTLVGDTYTTNAITADCSVDASFTQITHSVTPSAGANGSITPATPQTVAQGGTIAFTVAADVGYSAVVGGTCGGTLAGNTYTTNGITADCTVEASFAQNTYTVTPSAGANGSITPGTPQTAAHGSTIAFTVTPDAGYSALVTGTCGGTLGGTTYTTNAITANCTVDVAYQVVAGTGGTPILVPTLSPWSLMLLAMLMMGVIAHRRLR